LVEDVLGPGGFDIEVQPGPGVQPDWEELAARWLDLIRPMWYEKLEERGRWKPLFTFSIRAVYLSQVNAIKNQK
jgi:hypothetical protein